MLISRYAILLSQAWSLKSTQRYWGTSSGRAPPQKAGWHFFKHSHSLLSSSLNSSTSNITPENEQQVDLMYHMGYTILALEQMRPLQTATISCWGQKKEFSLLQPAQACPKWMWARGSLLSAREGWMAWRPVFHFELRSGTSNSKHRSHHSPWAGAQIPVSHTHVCSEVINKPSLLDFLGNPAPDVQNCIYSLFLTIFSAFVWIASSLAVPVLKSYSPWNSYTVMNSLCCGCCSKTFPKKDTHCSVFHW